MAIGDLPAPVISTVNVTASTALKLAFNPKRSKLVLENLSLEFDVWVNWGDEAVVGHGRRMQAAGGMIEIDINRPGEDDWAKDAIHMIATGASADVSIEEVSSP